MKSELARLAINIPTRAIRAFGTQRTVNTRPTEHNHTIQAEKRSVLAKRMLGVMRRRPGQQMSLSDVADVLGIPVTRWTREVIGSLVDTGALLRKGTGKGTKYWVAGGLTPAAGGRRK